MDPRPDALDAVVTAVLASRRYRHVHPPLVRRLATAALHASAGRPAEAVKRTKRALHQIVGAYLPTPPAYARHLAELRAAPDDAAVRAVLRRAMAEHASTRERLPVLEPFAAALGPELGRPRVVLDVACGLLPLLAPWLGWGAGTELHAWDVDVALVGFVDACLRQLGLGSHAAVVDLLDVPAWPRADVALVLKTLPCLEQQRAGAGEALLEAIDAPLVVVSFPTRSLSGRSKGMHESYARGFAALLARRGWDASERVVGTELLYFVRRSA